MGGCGTTLFPEQQPTNCSAVSVKLTIQWAINTLNATTSQCCSNRVRVCHTHTPTHPFPVHALFKSDSCVTPSPALVPSAHFVRLCFLRQAFWFWCQFNVSSVCVFLPVTLWWANLCKNVNNLFHVCAGREKRF